MIESTDEGFEEVGVREKLYVASAANQAVDVSGVKGIGVLLVDLEDDVDSVEVLDVLREDVIGHATQDGRTILHEMLLSVVS